MRQTKFPIFLISKDTGNICFRISQLSYGILIGCPVGIRATPSLPFPCPQAWRWGFKNRHGGFALPAAHPLLPLQSRRELTKANTRLYQQKSTTVLCLLKR